MENKKSNETFCANLVSFRKKRGMTQADIASALGISDKTYSKWETGETDVGIASVIQLAEFYGISPARFFDNEECGDNEEAVGRFFDNLSPAECVQKSFEIQFSAIRALTKRALFNHDYQGAMRVDVPENRVNPKNDHAITAFASVGVYEMMYNGNDANIALSLMPNKENYVWLKSEREMLSDYLSLIGNSDMLKCIPFMIDVSFPDWYSAEYLAQCSGACAETVKSLLERCLKLDVCYKRQVYVGEKIIDMYSTVADQMLVGILTLAHLSLPTAEKNGCYYFNMPARQIMAEGEVF